MLMTTTRRWLPRTWCNLLATALAWQAVAAQAQDAGPAAGDDGGRGRFVAAIEVPPTDSPIQEVRLEAPGGEVDLRFFWRRPRGKGPFPAVLFLHGGGGQATADKLRHDLKAGPVPTRFLAAGFAVVACTRRPFWTAKNDAGDAAVGFDDAVDDTVRIVAKVRTLPAVDGRRVVLYGGSGGGILAIVAASRTDVAGVIAGEPATVVPLAPAAGNGGAGPGGYRGVMADPHAVYVGDRREAMRAWMEGVGCPVLVLQGKPVGLHTVNSEILVPELRALGKQVTVADYPDATHGFYWGDTRAGATPELVDRFVGDALGFIRATDAAAAPERQPAIPR